MTVMEAPCDRNEHNIAHATADEGRQRRALTAPARTRTNSLPLLILEVRRVILRCAIPGREGAQRLCKERISNFPNTLSAAPHLFALKCNT